MNKFCTQARYAMIGAVLAGLTGCGGGGSDSPPPQGANPPPAPAPAPAPPPAPPPEPPPAPAPDVPPLSSVIVNLDANQRVGTVFWPNGNTAAGGTGQDVEGIYCAPSMFDAYHVHAHVSIIVDGEALAIPENVGIVPSPRCFYQIHTHDLSGKIHIEAEAPGTFTLGQLFAIWGQPLETDNVAGLTGKPIVIYTTDNATVTRVTTDWKQIEMTSKKLITIQVGTPLTEIPNYAWSSN